LIPLTQFNSLLSYKESGVDRDLREHSKKAIYRALGNRSIQGGRLIDLPSGSIFSFGRNSTHFYDLQIEGVGTKTLLAEAAGDYRTIGIDGVAMVVNDIIRSGATPILLADCVHISRSEPRILSEILEGVLEGANMSGALLLSGETGDVPDILHQPLHGTEKSPPFDLTVSCLGMVRRTDVISGRIEAGDEIIGLESSGIHSNGISLARRVLLKRWGGKFEGHEKQAGFEDTILGELLTPTRIYAKAILDLAKRTEVRAAVHITGDSFAKFRRLASFQNKRKLGFSFRLEGEIPPIFRLIFETSRESGSPLHLKEMFRTFNMGYGFAVIVDKSKTELATRILNRHFPSRKIGNVTADGDSVRILSELSGRNPIKL
jgi:phosphoribosylformylglycinamidine cyclo-ligase